MKLMSCEIRYFVAMALCLGFSQSSLLAKQQGVHKVGAQSISMGTMAVQRYLATEVGSGNVTKLTTKTRQLESDPGTPGIVQSFFCVSFTEEKWANFFKAFVRRVLVTSRLGGLAADACPDQN